MYGVIELCYVMIKSTKPSSSTLVSVSLSNAVFSEQTNHELSTASLSPDLSLTVCAVFSVITLIFFFVFHVQIFPSGSDLNYIFPNCVRDNNNNVCDIVVSLIFNSINGFKYIFYYILLKFPIVCPCAYNSGSFS